MAQRPNRFPSEAMTINSWEAALIGLALAVAWAAATLSRALLLSLVALLLTFAGWRPRPVVFSEPSPEPRLSGHPAKLKGLARTGRRAELLAALAG